MWVPGAERYFNQIPGRAVVSALAENVRNPLAETSWQRPGLPGLVDATYTDVQTLMLLVRPRLQNYASPGEHFSMVVESVNAKLGKA